MDYALIITTNRAIEAVPELCKTFIKEMHRLTGMTFTILCGGVGIVGTSVAELQVSRFVINWS